MIWPNLSDENNGAGLVTYMRLVEGGSLAIGDGEARGYVEICEDLSVKTWSMFYTIPLLHSLNWSQVSVTAIVWRTMLIRALLVVARRLRPCRMIAHLQDSTQALVNPCLTLRCRKHAVRVQ